ncbi:hypothetical protein MKX07_004200 [Trichoderma sp. CBMAI-0711]|uniref:Uncharacterized protein n=1 Tax=Trichoderma parareesei TaxID=858221 RepID=A0A2H2ZUM4_TRIPA|nr:hypothetical protein MKX07_004200 [Trichoderma sp. CBMAI-0711]OTA05706.1 hypothetical protein A9Z42_0064050 [Trichoderma parareesei]
MGEYFPSAQLETLINSNNNPTTSTAEPGAGLPLLYARMHLSTRSRPSSEGIDARSRRAQDALRLRRRVIGDQATLRPLEWNTLLSFIPLMVAVRLHPSGALGSCSVSHLHLTIYETTSGAGRCGPSK